MSDRRQSLYTLEWRPASAAEDAGEARGTVDRWLILADSAGIADTVADLLSERGQPCDLVRHTEPEPDLQAALRALVADAHEGRATTLGVIHLWSLDARCSDSDGPLGEAHLLGIGSMLSLVRALALGASIENVRLWIVTGGSQPVDAGWPVEVAQAPLWGLSRTLPFEHPEWNTVAVDLDPVALGDAPHHAAQLLVEELSSGDRERHVAFRNGERYVQRLVRLEGPEPGSEAATAGDQPEAALQPDRTYLISGGLGFVGLHLAEWLVKRGARRLTLVGRNDPASDARCTLDALGQMGAVVTIRRADVAEADQVRRIVSETNAGPHPLAGVIHLAGIFDDAVVTELDDRRLRAVMAGRAQGAWNLHTATSGRDLDFFVMFSSAVSVLGSPGQAALAASNAFLDALSFLRSARGLRTVALNWTPLGVGVPEGSDLVPFIDLAQAFEIMADVLDDDVPQVLVSAQDLVHLLTFYPRAGEQTLFEELLGDTAVRVHRYARGTLDNQYVAPRDRVERVIAGVVRRTLGLDKVGVTDDFFELGGDSVMASGILARVNTVFGVDISLGDAVDAFTIERLASMVRDLVSARIDDLTDAEAAGLLEKMKSSRA